jgi:predicted metalloprotease with PDZ domain
MMTSYIRSLKFALTIVFALSIQSTVCAQSSPVAYQVTLDKNPTTHFLHVSLQVDSGGAASIGVAMPAWSPGAYGIRNEWRNVQEFLATDETGAALKFEKVDKQTWRIAAANARRITARYKLYYRSYNDELCYIAGPGVFMYVVGKRPYPLDGPVSVGLDAPSGWLVQTGLAAGKAPGSYVADSYDTFIDASIAIGRKWEETRFDSKGVPHYIVFIGKGNYDKQKITDDTKAVVTYLAEMMGGLPYNKYVFFLRVRPGQGSGGLEHLNSTDISFSAYNTHQPEANYKRFMFVVAHEFFHLWNVKRIRPAILGPFDYTHEQNTRNLYVSEGMTSYWAAIGLKRSGVWSLKDFYDDLTREITTLQSSPGRKIMSVELSSWDTWNQGDNATNNRIDYYNKGQLIGNLLDLEIRHRTGNQRSLTDVFLYLMKNHGLPKPGFEEKRGFRDAVELITREAAPSNADFGDFFGKYVSGTEEIPWNAFFDHAGLMLEEKKGSARPYIGITTGNTLPGAGFFNAAPTVLPQGQIAVTNVAPGSPAEEAGLDVGDVLVAMDGDRVEAGNFNDRFNERKNGAIVVFTVLRRDQLRSITVTVGKEEPVTYSIKEKPDATEMQKKIFVSWLGENQSK